MKKLTYLFILPLFASCAEKPAEFKSVPAKEFATIIEDTNVVRLDVRTVPEYLRGHIEGSINIDVLKDSFEIKAINSLDKSSTIALYCRSGRRSKDAARILAENGFNVVELESGYNGWTEYKEKHDTITTMK